MGVVNLKSTVITNRDATPKVLTDAYVSGGGIYESQGYITTGAADSIASIYRLCQVPSNARVSDLIIQTDALATGCTLDVGVYYPTYMPVGAGLLASNASAAIDADFFATAVAASNANASTSIINESGTNTIAKQELPLWSALGLTADPGINLDICVTVAGTVAAAGAISLKAKYCE